MFAGKYPVQINAMPAQPPLVFIIYARKDAQFRDELKAQLRPMEIAQQLRVWSDSELIAGEHWEPAIKDKLKNADIILLLVSSDYFASDYIHKVELREAIERHKQGEARVVPIIIRPCHWKPDPVVSSLQVLPTNGVPVDDPRHWHTRENAWVDVVQGVSLTLEQMLKERATKEKQAQAEIEQRRRQEQERAKAEAKQRALEEKHRRETEEKEARREAEQRRREARLGNAFPPRRTLMLLAGVLLAIVLGYALWPPTTPVAGPVSPEQNNGTADADWVATQKAGAIPAYRQFLEKYPSGPYRAEAENRLQALEKNFDAHRTDAINLLGDQLGAAARIHLDSMLRLWPGHGATIDARNMADDGLYLEAADLLK